MPTIRSRKTKSGATRFHAIVRKTGFASVSKTFRSERDARRWGVETETELERGRYFDRFEATRHTVSEAIDRYIATEMARRARPAKDELAQLRWWKGAIGCCN